MSHEKFEKLLAEMDTIARKVKLFPDELQETVFKSLVDILISGESVGELPAESTGIEQGQSANGPISDQTQNDEMKFSQLLRVFYSDYSLSSLNDMDLCPWVAYFYTNVVPDTMKVDSIDLQHLEEFCRISRRNPPKNFRSALNNSKNNREYLRRAGKGRYTLSEKGKRFVETTIRGESVT